MNIILIGFFIFIFIILLYLYFSNFSNCYDCSNYCDKKYNFLSKKETYTKKLNDLNNLNSDQDTFFVNLLYYIDTKIQPGSAPENQIKFGIVSQPVITEYLININNNIEAKFYNINVNGYAKDMTGPTAYENHSLQGDNTGGFLPLTSGPIISVKPCSNPVVVDGISYNTSDINGQCYGQPFARPGSTPDQCINPSFPFRSGVNPGRCYSCSFCNSYIDTTCPATAPIKGETYNNFTDPNCYLPCPPGWRAGSKTRPLDNGWENNGLCYPNFPNHSSNVVQSIAERTVCDSKFAVYAQNYGDEADCRTYEGASGNTQVITSINYLLCDSNYIIPAKGYSNILYLNNSNLSPYVQTGPINISVSPFTMVLTPPMVTNATHNLKITLPSINISTNMFVALQPAINNVKFDLIATGNTIILNIPIFIGSSTPTFTSNYCLLRTIQSGNIYIIHGGNTSMTIDLTCLHYISLLLINTLITLIADILETDGVSELIGKPSSYVISGLSFLLNKYENGLGEEGSVPIIGPIINSWITQGLSVELSWKNDFDNMDPLSTYLSSLIVPQLNFSVSNVLEDIPILGWVTYGFMAKTIPYISTTRTVLHVINTAATIIADIRSTQEIINLIKKLRSLARICIYLFLVEVLSIGVMFLEPEAIEAELVAISEEFSIFGSLSIGVIVKLASIGMSFFSEIAETTELLEKINELYNDIMVNPGDQAIFQSIMSVVLANVFNCIGINQNISSIIPSNLIDPPSNWTPGSQATPGPTTTSTTTPGIPTIPPPQYFPQSINDFYFTGNKQYFRIPDGYSGVTFFCWGGGGGSTRGDVSRGGNGAYISGYFDVNTNDIITISVGEAGIPATETQTPSAYGGGGQGVKFSGGGGGCSSLELNNIIILTVAGGGGSTYNGFGIYANGGYGGTDIESGGNGEINGGRGGVPGRSTGGVGGQNGGNSGTSGSRIISIGLNGAIGKGGNGGNTPSSSIGGGAGGGGYNGGGGGDPGTGGGGGSSFVSNRITVYSRSSNGVLGNLPFQMRTIPGRGGMNNDFSTDGFIRLVLQTSPTTSPINSTTTPIPSTTPLTQIYIVGRGTNGYYYYYNILSNISTRTLINNIGEGPWINMNLDGSYLCSDIRDSNNIYFTPNFINYPNITYITPPQNIKVILLDSTNNKIYGYYTNTGNNYSTLISALITLPLNWVTINTNYIPLEIYINSGNGTSFAIKFSKIYYIPSLAGNQIELNSPLDPNLNTNLFSCAYDRYNDILLLYQRSVPINGIFSAYYVLNIKQNAGINPLTLSWVPVNLNLNIISYPIAAINIKMSRGKIYLKYLIKLDGNNASESLDLYCNDNITQGGIWYLKSQNTQIGFTFDITEI
jgi:hypothetical protein